MAPFSKKESYVHTNFWIFLDIFFIMAIRLCLFEINLSSALLFD